MTTEILDCGHSPSPHFEFTTGYGVDKDGKKHCYPCCAVTDLNTMDLCHQEGKPFSAYVSSDGLHITTWPGDHLATVVSSYKLSRARRWEDPLYTL